jgi:CHAD domain-containing protein
MMRDRENVRRLAETLRENLVRCGHDPDVDAVHDTRTGTRRLQATLENVVRELPEGDEGDTLRETATALMRQLKKIRHAAGPVRDLDVHRKLLDKLMERALDPGARGDEGDENAAGPRKSTRPVSVPDVLETEQAGLRTTGISQQADDLDAWLKHRRSDLARGLQSAVSGMVAKLDKRLAALEEALGARRAQRMRKKPPGVVALDSFARLATEMQMLDAGNLHDFRKGAKKARYVAELAAQGDVHARRVGETLKKLQDEIGDWHDWLVLAEEAHTALGEEATELIALVEGERERHFVAAMKTAAKLRGRLMGEWLALGQRAAYSGQRQRVAGGREPGQPGAGSWGPGAGS